MHTIRCLTGARFVRANLALLAALMGVLLAACGSDDKTPTSRPLQAQPAASAIRVGQPAPDFTLTSATGESVSLAAYKGQQPVLLFFHMAAG